LKLTVSPLGTKSNSRTHASKVVVPARVVSAASPGIPLLKLARLDSKPAVLIALPDVSTIPLSIVIGVVTDVNVPLATPAQLSVGADIVIPGPASLPANTAAGWLGVTVS
jgi:hypothetical protein